MVNTNFTYAWVFVNMKGKHVQHSPLGDHEEVGLVDLGVSEVPVLGKTSVLNFLKKLEEESE